MEEELKSMKMTIFKLKVTRDGRKLRFHLQGQTRASRTTGAKGNNLLQVIAGFSIM